MAIGATYPLSVLMKAVDRLTGPMDKVGGKAVKVGRQISKVGKGLTFGITAPTLALGAATFNAAAGFQSTFNSVEAITGAQGPQLQALRDQALDLGRSTQFMARQVAEGQEKLSIAGLAVNETLQATPSILRLASASGREFGFAAETAVGTMRAARKEAGDLDSVVDMLTNTFTSSTTELGDLSEAIVDAVPVLSGFGTPLSEQLALIGALGDNMFRGSKAGIALRNAYAILANAPPVSRAVLQSLGIQQSQIVDSQGNVRSLIDIIGLLEEKGATTGQVMLLFGRRTGPGMAALVARGKDSLEQLEEKILRVGTAQRIADVRMQGASGKLMEFKAATEGLMIALGDSGLLQAVTELLTTMTPFVQKWAQANPTMLRNILITAGVAAAIGPLVVIMGQAIVVGGAMITVFGKLGLWTALSALGKLILFKAIPAFIAFNAVLWANPLTWIAAAIVGVIAAGVLLVKHWRTVRQAAIDTWNTITGFVGSAVDWLFDKIKAVAGLVPDWLIELLGGSTATSTIIERRSAVSLAPRGPAVDLSGRAGGGAEKTLNINFKNAPPGTTVDGDAADMVDLFGWGFDPGDAVSTGPILTGAF